ncbi:hypothetical protein Dsin_032553 [Dipteronia sinensis]|uniref:Wall-associated receptor kinase C-terminal domain-containing protein n=1 Tax=Dipteronia sinensis TaxID=43782 RepID=A0AAE0DL19_9ROSI|nr:hypothetical protein Dsin_032553 [Dipteronia sinensis]
MCDSCEGSNGLCGYDSDTTEFTCYCPDQPYPFTCPPSRGVSAGLGGIVLILVLVTDLDDGGCEKKELSNDQVYVYSVKVESLVHRI